MIAILRASTASAHHALEAQLGSFNSVGSLLRYRDLLLAYRRLFAALSPRLEHTGLVVTWTHNLPERLAQLDRDLSRLPTTSEPPPPTDLAIDDLPVIASAAQQAGFLYVIEGSALGGLGLARALAQRIPALDDTTLQFFYGLGPRQTGARWQAFVAWLETQPWSPADHEAAATTAAATFTLFADHLSAVAAPTPAATS